MIDGKQGGEWCTVGEYKGGKEGRKKARRGENVRRGVVVRVQLLVRAYI